MTQRCDVLFVHGKCTLLIKAPFNGQPRVLLGARSSDIEEFAIYFQNNDCELAHGDISSEVVLCSAPPDLGSMHPR